ncbi:MAG: metallophosphoesterase [Bryobacteraceae bacterium]
MSRIVSWIHFGDLHIAGRNEQNYRDFLSLIDEANRNMSSSIDFALLPGDSADDGEEDEYRLVRQALGQCRFPVHAIAGDHDVVSGTLDLFRKYLADPPYRSFVLDAHRFVLLNSVAHWRPPVFGLGDKQMKWLRGELRLAHSARERVVVFMHAYPSEHGADAAELRRLFRNCGILLVEMGHTHYNELANDGLVIYAATRSTGQIEEGSAGFSVTTLDDGVVSWKFKPIGEWPLVMVTSPADERLIIDSGNPLQVVRECLQVRARVWGASIETVTLSVDKGEPVAMEALDAGAWGVFWNPVELADGSHLLGVNARTSDGHSAEDRITVHVNLRGEYSAPARLEPDYQNAIGAWAEKHILGTQLGPNENGHPWPPRRERAGVTQ